MRSPDVEAIEELPEGLANMVFDNGEVVRAILYGKLGIQDPEGGWGEVHVARGGNQRGRRGREHGRDRGRGSGRQGSGADDVDDAQAV